MAESRWFRLCIDVDESGHPIGSSFEVHEGQAMLQVTVEPLPGPFDTTHEVMERLEASAANWRRLTLFP
jgi:hypothetical protein